MESPTVKSRTLPPVIRRIVRDSRTWLLAFVVLVIALCLTIREEYPFSHFPMYGNPNARPVDYYFLTDGNGEPLPVVALTGDTAPRIKKRLQTRLRQFLREQPRRMKLEEIPEATREEIARTVLQGFLDQAIAAGRELPDKVQLWQGLIHQTEDGYRETFQLEAAN